MNTILKLIRSKKAIGLTLICLLPGVYANAQAATDTGNTEFMFYMVVGLVFFVTLLVLITAIFTLRVLNVIVNKEISKKVSAEGAEPVAEPSVVTQLMNKLTDIAPVEKEKDILLDHNYDGIRELDNHLPPWWLYLFYFTIAFGVFYLLAYHVFDKLPLQEQEYQTELTMAAEAKMKLAEENPTKEVDETNITFEDNNTMITAGQKVFDMQCASCHAQDGGGIVGPNLTDKYWIHGGSIKDVYRTIRYGVVQKGMIPWEGVISNSQMRDVSMYIMTLQGTTSANPKAEQGELYEGDINGEGAAPLEEDASDEATGEDTASEEPAVADNDALAKGKSVYDLNCMACHLADGGGSVGPNFTDDFWIHGCSEEDIIKLIKVGVPIKGMISWEGILNEEEITSVTAYIMSLRGNTPENPKDPQGDECLN